MVVPVCHRYDLEQVLVKGRELPKIFQGQLLSSSITGLITAGVAGGRERRIRGLMGLMCVSFRTADVKCAIKL